MSWTLTTPYGRAGQHSRLGVRSWWQQAPTTSRVFVTAGYLVLLFGLSILIARVVTPANASASFHSGVDYANRNSKAIGLRAAASGRDTSSHAAKAAITIACTAALNSANASGGLWQHERSGRVVAWVRRCGSR